MKNKKVRLFRYLMIVFLLIMVWWLIKLIGCGGHGQLSNNNLQVAGITLAAGLR